MSKLKVTLKRSVIGQTRVQRETVKGLGLKKIDSYKILQDSPSVRGMVNRVSHLVTCEEVK